MKQRVLIIGGVAGGASAAARLRRLSEETEIVIFERGPYISYANCGLPYHVGGVIRERDALLLQTPEVMRERFNIDVRVLHEVTAIDREQKRIEVKNVDTGETTSEAYDTLIIATGSSPLRPPIPGIDGKRVFPLWTVPDTDRIKAYIEQTKPESAVIVGGGFIGLEMAENLHAAGIKVRLVELMNQVMPPLDVEMARIVETHLLEQGVELTLGNGVKAFEDGGDGVDVVLNDGTRHRADMVVLSIGIRPNGELAKAAGLDMNQRGGIVTDAYLKTSDENIYAVGDAIETTDFIFEDRTMVPLAGPANKQGRICANNIMGAKETYDGTQGTSVAKVFELAAASTGASEKVLIRRGLAKGKDYETATIIQRSHAGYYPGSSMMTVKLIFSMDGKKIFGAQIVGNDGVDKRIDIIATTIRLRGGIEDLKDLELAYAPPYSSAKDPVNMAGFVAENILSGQMVLAKWDAYENRDGQTQWLDVREDAELAVFSLPGFVHIPVGTLRGRLGELDRNREVVVFCEIGVRAHVAARLLLNSGFKDVKVYPGGMRLYRLLFGDRKENKGEATTMPTQNAKTELKSTAAGAVAALRVDCSGMQCPGPIMKVFQTINAIEDGQAIEVIATDPGFVSDAGTWCRRTGNTLLGTEKRNGEYVVYIQKGVDDSARLISHAHTALPNGKSIIVFSGDLDKALASFIIANGAAAMGRRVTMFFTFWGLNILRKSEKKRVKKAFLEAMFGGMMPRGAKRAKLSKLNMLGMGTFMMKKVMRDKNVDMLETMMQKAMQNGVKLIACTMSMDIMGIKAEELIDGIDYAGVATYLGEAEEADVNLFI